MATPKLIDQKAPAQPLKPTKGELSEVTLLEVSASLFHERGYGATTMRAIAEAAGMRAASVYYHFQSKDEILQRVLEHGISTATRGFREALAQLPEDAPFEAKFNAGVTAHLRTVVASDVVIFATRQLLRVVPLEMRQNHYKMRDDYGAMWRKLLDEGVAQGAIPPNSDLSLASLLMLGSLNWANEWADPNRKSVEDLSAIACNLFLKGLRQA